MTPTKVCCKSKQETPKKNRKRIISDHNDRIMKAPVKPCNF